MEVVHLERGNAETAAIRAADILRGGGVVLYPTDTLYGLGVDAFSDEAVAKIFSIKGRNEGKPIHAIVADIAMAEMYAEITSDVRVLAEKLPRGKVTFICRKKVGLDTGIVKGIDTFGFRIPDSELCIEMARAFGPITATSANVAGEIPQRSVDAILAQLGKRAQRIDLVIDAGELPERAASTVVDLSAVLNGEPRILREAAVPASAVLAALLE